MSAEKNTILITRATGNVGWQVVSQLLGAGVRIRALTRNPDSASLPHEVEVVRGAPSATDTLDEHLDGSEAVFLVWRSLTADGDPFLNAVAKRARRIVFLSSSAVRDDVQEQANLITATVDEITGALARTFRQWAIDQTSDFQEGRAQ